MSWKSERNLALGVSDPSRPSSSRSASRRRAVRSGSPVIRSISPRSNSPRQVPLPAARSFRFQRWMFCRITSQPPGQIVEVQEVGHKGHLVEADFQEQSTNSRKAASRGCHGRHGRPGAACRRGPASACSHHGSPALARGPGIPTRGHVRRCRDIGHCVTHQPADAAVAVGKGMDVVEPVVADAIAMSWAAFPTRSKRKRLSKCCMKSATALARWRHVPPDRHIVLRSAAPFARHHPELAITRPDDQHAFRGIAIELAMQPAQNSAEAGAGRVPSTASRSTSAWTRT